MTNRKLKTAEKQARKKAKNPDELLEQASFRNYTQNRRNDRDLFFLNKIG